MQSYQQKKKKDNLNFISLIFISRGGLVKGLMKFYYSFKEIKQFTQDTSIHRRYLSFCPIGMRSINLTRQNALCCGLSTNVVYLNGFFISKNYFHQRFHNLNSSSLRFHRWFDWSYSCYDICTFRCNNHLSNNRSFRFNVNDASTLDHWWETLWNCTKNWANFTTL